MIETLLALGCSHTAGIGLLPNQLTYVDIVSRSMKIHLDNQAIPGGNADRCLAVLLQRLRTQKPKLVIVQWPNIYRRTFYQGDIATLENINIGGDNFYNTLQCSELNFVMPWIQRVQCANLLCRFAQVPIYHLYLDSLDSFVIDQLQEHHIIIHYDEKLPGKTWFFDSAGEDKIHHSAQCHQKWAERLIGIIDENTA